MYTSHWVQSYIIFIIKSGFSTALMWCIQKTKKKQIGQKRKREKEEKCKKKNVSNLSKN